MTRKIAWITDSAAQLEQSFMEKYNVFVLPLSVVFDGKTFREDIDLTQQQFYEKLKTIETPPKTSQPPIGEMIALYEQLKKDGYDCAIALHVSSGMSGTIDSARSAAKMVDFDVYPIDSKIGSYPMIRLIEHGIELLEQGKEIAEVVTSIDQMTRNVELAFIPVDLSQLHKSGRVSGTQLFISNLLNIKVLIAFEDGKPVVQEKVRSYKRARTKITERFRNDMANGTIKEVAVIHCNNELEAQSWSEELHQEFPELKIQILSLSICVGVHAGEGTTGLSWCRS